MVTDQSIFIQGVNLQHTTHFKYHRNVTPRLQSVGLDRGPPVNAYTVASCIYFVCSTIKHRVHYTLGLYVVDVTCLTVSVICKPIFVHRP